MSGVMQNYLTNDDAFHIGGVWPKTKVQTEDGYYRTLYVAPLHNQAAKKSAVTKETKEQHREAQASGTPSRVAFGPTRK